MHNESDIKNMDYIRIVQQHKTYDLHVFGMNDRLLHVKADLEQLGTSVVPRPVNLKYNYSELIRTLVELK